MKIIKQPMFFLCFGALIGAVLIAVFSTMLNPVSSVVKRVEKGLNEMDAEILASCVYNSEEVVLGTEILDALTDWLGIDEGSMFEFEFLVSETEYNPLVTEYQIPSVVVVKVNDTVISVEAQDIPMTKIDNREYILQ